MQVEQKRKKKKEKKDRVMEGKSDCYDISIYL